MPFALTLGIDDGVMNYTELDDSATCEKWDAESKEFGEAKLNNKTVKGNFVRMIDEDGNKKSIEGYNKRTYDRVTFNMPKGYKDKLHAYMRERIEDIEVF